MIETQLQTQAADGGRNSANVFELGLTLAGAISAGAYTAGVLDFLFQALDEWDNHRGRPGVPADRVAIKVVTGASAGAITGALSVIALARGLHPVEYDQRERENCYPSYRPQDQAYRCVLPALWRTWVELPDMLRSGNDTGLLGTSDLKTSSADLRSLLDASVLDRIKTSAIAAPADPEEGQLRQTPAEYISARLHVFMTLSNMRGIPYKVGFGRLGNKYGMITHGDRAHYVISGLGGCDTHDSDWLAEDAREAATALSVNTLPQHAAAPIPEEWDDYGTAALASGAFPIGLAPRGLRYAARHYTRRKLPIELQQDVFITPDFPANLDQLEALFTFQTVDGGMVNNNPFDYAQFALFGRPPARQDAREGRRAILMVAPFPDPPKFPPEGSPAPTLTAILRALYPALINQARFRISELAPALDDRDYSRFLIAPRRQIPRTRQPPSGEPPAAEERYAIASGLLGGFGGFLDEEFRSHDFQLGRRNCQLFLSRFMTVPAGGLVEGSLNADREVPVIPLMGSAATTVPLPRWPVIEKHKFALIQAAISRRLNRVVSVLINGETKSRYLRVALHLGWWCFLRGRTRQYVHAAFLSDLVRRRQISGYEPPQEAIVAAESAGGTADDVAAVGAELISPAYRFRTEAGIAAALRIEAALVRVILRALSPPNVPQAVRS